LFIGIVFPLSWGGHVGMRHLALSSQWTRLSATGFGLGAGWAPGVYTDVAQVVVTDLTRCQKNCPQMAVGTRLGDLGAGINSKTC